MKTLKQIREDYDHKFLELVEQSPEELMLEDSVTGNEKLKTKFSRIPSSKEMPVMLVFRRISYRVYPNKQVVALYYSHMIDKYLSIPFGPGGNVNLSEAVILDSIDEDWQDVNRKDKTDGLSQKAVNAYRRENPGSRLQTAVTEKNPTGKRAARRKSFCSRMGGMKKRLTSAKTARDPDSRINKALRRWNCEEDFKVRLEELRMQQNEGIASALDAGAEAIVPYYSAGKKLYKGDYKGAATDAAIDTALIGTGAAIGKVGLGAAKLAGKGFSKIASKLGKSAPKTSDMIAGMSRAGKEAAAAKKAGIAGNIVRKAGRGLKSVAKGAGRVAGRLGGAALDALSNANNSSSGSSTTVPKHGGFVRPAGAINTGSSWSASSNKSDATTRSKLKAADLAQAKAATSTVKENKMSDLRKMINEGVENKDININGKTITLNNSMAKRILEVYDSVNTKNKKIVEGMLNEDLESFKKLLNFSIRN